MNEELYHELEIVVKATFFLDFLVSRCRTFGSDGFSELASGLFLFKIEIFWYLKSLQNHIKISNKFLSFFRGGWI